MPKNRHNLGLFDTSQTKWIRDLLVLISSVAAMPKPLQVNFNSFKDSSKSNILNESF
jgi:hypothetical protein